MEIERGQQFKEELKVPKLEQEALRAHNDQISQQMFHSNAIQQQQMKQIFEMTNSMMLQQQQQTTALMALIEKFATKK